MKLHCCLAVLVMGVARIALGAEISCPELAGAIQAGTCPSEEELRYTFTGYCSDNARLYAKDVDTCTSYENYRKLKNVVLWEAGAGDFQAYVSCELAPSAVTSAKVRRMAVGNAGKLSRVSCDYGDGVIFVHRTRLQCSLPAGECAGPICKADCK